MNNSYNVFTKAESTKVLVGGEVVEGTILPLIGNITAPDEEKAIEMAAELSGIDAEHLRADCIGTLSSFAIEDELLSAFDKVPSGLFELLLDKGEVVEELSYVVNSQQESIRDTDMFYYQVPLQYTRAVKSSVKTIKESGAFLYTVPGKDVFIIGFPRELGIFGEVTSEDFDRICNTIRKNYR